MNRRTKTGVMCLAMTIVMGLCHPASAAKQDAEVPLTAQGEMLLAKYSDMLGRLKADIAKALPAVDAKKKAAFLTAHAAVADVPPQPNPNGLTNAPPRYAPSHKLYAEAQSNAVVAAPPLLSDLDAFLSSDKLDVKLRKLALIAHATPRDLAIFAQHGKAEEALFAELLGDDALIKQIMEMGGCHSRRYGKAMQSYKAIQKASKRAKDGFWQRFALASAMEHPQGCQTGGNSSQRKEGMTDAEVNVEVFLDYEKAYLEGKLDEAFGTYSDFNWRFVMHIYSVEDLNWMRDMLRNYRPDHIRNPDYKWRYCRITKTDVPYVSGVDRSGMPPELSRFQKFFLKGGICGARCFTGKLATTAFGVPTRFASQKAHAAMCHWTPDGWTTVFGGHWTFNHHGDICGLDFSLEERARNATNEYAKVNRAEWVGYALDQTKVSKRVYGVHGDFWNALAFYKKLAIVEAAEIAELAPTGESLAESNVEAEPEKVHQIELTAAQTTVVIGEDGVITIPSGAAYSTVNTNKLRFMHTIDGDEVQVHYSLGGGQPELLKFKVEAPAAGKYELTAEVCTVTLDREFMLRLNRRTLIDIALPYTKGYWGKTKPTPVDLKEGRNTFQFTIKAPNKGISIKHFKLKPVK
jgi:hypothetical protein